MLLIIVSGVVLLATGEKTTKEDLSESEEEVELMELDAESGSDVHCSFFGKDADEPI